MQVMVTIQLAEGDAEPDANEVGEKIFQALGCDREKDMCMVTVQAAPVFGHFGRMPGTEPAPADGGGE